YRDADPRQDRARAGARSTGHPAGSSERRPRSSRRRSDRRPGHTPRDTPRPPPDRVAVVPIGEQVRSVAPRRGAAIVAVTADQAFAAAVAGRVLTLDRAHGRLSET